MSGMTPDDVFALRAAADPRISPDGGTVAYVVQAVNREGNAYTSAIWLQRVDRSKEARQLTRGEKQDGEPRWSPDGTRLAFTSNRDGDTAQLYVLPLCGGEPRKLTSLEEDVTEATWSPDGSAIAFVARVRDAAYDEKDERRRAPRRITRLQYKLEHVGWTADRPRHVFTVAADGSGEPVQLTAGDFEDAGPSWSPDGEQIAFVSARHPDWDTDTVRDVYLVDSAGGKPRRLTPGGAAVEMVSWSPDGRRLAAQHYEGVLDDPRHTQIAVVDAETGAVQVVTGSLDRNCGAYPQLREPLWEGDDLVFAVEDHGNTHLYRTGADGTGIPRLVVGGDLAVTGFDLVAGRLVYAASPPTRLPELFTAERRLTGVGDAFAETRLLSEPARFTARSADGTEVEAWVMKPAGCETGLTCPTLLCIHGGPFTQYGNHFFDEFQVYCGAGFAVVYANPRGSSGYSEEWGRAIRGDGTSGDGWGSVDYEDCMAVIDEAVRRFDFIDGDRLGVMGGSYGGYLTSWIVAHTNRFKAAISERAVNQLVSQWGSSDSGWDLRGYIGSFLHEDVEAYLRLSPASYAAHIHTPLLLLHSEEDLRCPVEQAEHLFVTLRLLRRPVELVRFPGESHELTRSGSPMHRVQRFEIVLEWFGRYLKSEAPSG